MIDPNGLGLFSVNEMIKIQRRDSKGQHQTPKYQHLFKLQTKKNLIIEMIDHIVDMTHKNPRAKTDTHLKTQ